LNPRLALVAMLALLVTLLAVAWNRSVPAPPSASETSRRPAPAPRSAAGSPPRLVRNPFEFGRAEPDPAVVAPRPVRPAVAPPPAVVAATPAPVRLVGLVHKGGALNAALMVNGELGLVQVGEVFRGFTLTAVDEDDGVRLRGPDGSELSLAPEQP
jgi:hypothetical protein